MQYDPESKTLTFSSEQEVEQFHSQLSLLLRHAMVEASRGVEDAQQAKAISREVFKECAIVTRALNVLRGSLTRRASS